MAIIPFDEYDNTGFEKFLKIASKWDKHTTFVCGMLETILKNINQNDNASGKLYDFCKEIKDTKLPLKIIHVTDKKQKFAVAGS